MKARLTSKNNILTIHLQPEETDREEFGNARLGNTAATYALPPSFDYTRCHADLLGLASLIVASPWTKDRLLLPFPVSEKFAKTVYSKTRITVSPTDSAISERSRGDNCGLAFSGGVDSIAAYEIMPSNTIGIFQQRSKRRDGKRTLYRDDAALFAIENMTQLGAELLVVESDAEFVRDPVGFSIDMSSGVPLILLADSLSFGSLSFGTISEAAWRTNTDKWADYRKRPVFTRWKAILDSVGLDLYMPVACIGELGTMRITKGSKYAQFAQSCVRGTAGNPCGKCIKCFRKRIIEASISGDWPDDSAVDRLFSSREVRNYLKKAPIPLEAILMESFSKYRGHNPWMLATKRRLEPGWIDTSFLHRFYCSGMNDTIPPRFVNETVGRASEYIKPMTPRQEKDFEAFDIRKKLEALSENGSLSAYGDLLDDFPTYTGPIQTSSNLLRRVISRIPFTDTD